MNNLVTRLEKLESKASIKDCKLLNIIVHFVSKESKNDQLSRLATDTSERSDIFIRQESESEDEFKERAFKEHRVKSKIKDQDGALLYQIDISNNEGEK